MAFVIDQRSPVTPEQVGQHFDMSTTRANWALCKLADNGYIARVSRGVYSGDPELRRRALQYELNRLGQSD
jgi:predicted transcriptional regulator of viral defense system